MRNGQPYSAKSVRAMLAQRLPDGAAQQDNYRGQIQAAGLNVIKIEDNPAYQFISDNARGASKKFGVKSVSLLAVKP